MFSKRVRFAFHCVGYLAHQDSPSPVPFSEILDYLKEYSRDLNLSASYIQKILIDLGRTGLVQGAVGRKGGYLLARSPDAIWLRDVVMAIDGVPQEGCCLMSVGPCDLDSSCGVKAAMRRAENAFYDTLGSESIESLARSMFGTGKKKASPGGKTSKGRGGVGKRSRSRK